MELRAVVLWHRVVVVVVVELVCELDVGGGRGLVCVQARGFSIRIS